MSLKRVPTSKLPSKWHRQMVKDILNRQQQAIQNGKNYGWRANGSLEHASRIEAGGKLDF